MKKLRKRKSKNIASEKGNSNSYPKIDVNPLIKHEIMQLFGYGKEKQEYPIWNNFEEPEGFQKAIQLLGYYMDIYVDRFF
ncbi:hypothetical protein GWI33_012324 [Rhynchophorus ferrugineus]|uniref:Uncharacterized protein n=1 Tax=Rhynchophorus ferrugineus TaxID=354439 RepID=A0A834IW59_RHYFE|nr:hypothetical protein GWI33_012324 [Rhynchophorus ferrugineus]